MSEHEDYCSGKPGTKHSDAYYSGGQCTACGYKGKLSYTRAFRYPELNGLIHLPNDGRALLGHRLYATEKRDGSNIHFWVDQYQNVRITSRNGPSECLD